MARTHALAALLLPALLLAGGPAAAQDAGAPAVPNDPSKPLVVRINQAIDSGVAWLMDKNQPADHKKNIYVPGNWSDEVTSDIFYDPNAKGDAYVHPTGCTSLALYALLKSGVPADDPAIKKGFDWLRGGSSSITKGKNSKGKASTNRIPNGTYEIAALILALEAKANPHKKEKDRERDIKFRLKKGEKLKLGVKLEPADEAWMKELAAALVKRLSGGNAWRYGQWTGTNFHNGYKFDKDLSATNLSMLALAAAERCGLQQPEKLYADVLKWTFTMQEKEGPEMPRWDPTLKEEDKVYGVGKDHARGFGYAGTDATERDTMVSSSMTACGLANIVICTTFLEARESPLYTGELAQKAEKAWWDGVAWLDMHWTVTENANRGNYHYYYLYCLERACDLKGINLIAGHPWYNLGAQVLVDQQGSRGQWDKEDTHRPSNILNTCFALLFLNRATPAITGD